MSGIEKDIKDRLGEHKGAEGIDSQALWDAVASGLEASKGTGALQLGRWFVGILLLLSVGTLGYLAFADASAITEEERPLASVELDGKERRSHLDMGTEEPASSASSTLYGSARSAGQDQRGEEDEIRRSIKMTSQGNEEALSYASKSAQTRSSDAAIEQSRSSEQSSALKRSESKTNAEVAISLDSEERSSTPSGVSENAKPLEIVNTKAIDRQSSFKDETWSEGTRTSEESALERRRMTALNALLLLQPEQLLRTSVHDIPKLEYRREPKKALPSEISLWLGSNMMQEQFGPGSDSNVIGSELQKTTKKDFGTSYALEANWTFNSGFRLSTGIMVDQFRTRFDRVSESSTTVAIEGQLIGFYQSPTSTPIPVYGTVEQEAVETRTILNHNDFTFISVPLSLGFEKVFRRSKIGVDIGAAWTRSLNQQGRSLNGDGTVASFTEGRSPFATDQITYQISPFIGRMISDSFELRVRPTFRSIPNKRSEFYQVDHSAMVLGVQFGLVYGLY